MQLHLPTLLVAMVLLSSTLTLVVGTLAWRSRHDGLPQLTIGLALHATTYALVMLRGSFPDELLLAAGNVAMAAGFAVINEAICRFQRRPPPRALLWAPPLAALVLQPWLAGQVAGRVATVAVLVGLQCLTALALLVQRRHATVGFGQYLLGVNFLAVFAILAYRAIAVVQAAPLPAVHETLQRVQSLSFALGAMTTIVMAMGFVVMTREAADERNRVLAMTDELTGLGNRRTLLEVLGRQASQSQRTGLPLSVVVIDIDRFKAVNDTLGHSYGDTCLSQVATVLRQQLQRKGDMVARLGGEEFGVILGHTDAEAACAIAERMRSAVADAAIHHPDPVNGGGLTISLGLVSWRPQSGRTAELDRLLQLADHCLYAAKDQGRDRLVVSALGEGEDGADPVILVR